MGHGHAPRPPPEPSVPSAVEAKKRREALGGEVGAVETETSIFANGCFWGTEALFRQYYAPAIKSAEVGFIGGDDETVGKDPSYREVCTGRTGHAEACKVEWDPRQVSYEELVDFFYRTHDPTQLNQQGPDIGTQYRSALFPTTPEQHALALKLTDEIFKRHFEPKGLKIFTRIEEPGKFKWWKAEDYHQRYLFNNPNGYECPSHIVHY